MQAEGEKERWSVCLDGGVDAFLWRDCGVNDDRATNLHGCLLSIELFCLLLLSSIFVANRHDTEKGNLETI